MQHLGSPMEPVFSASLQVVITPKPAGGYLADVSACQEACRLRPGSAEPKLNCVLLSYTICCLGNGIDEEITFIRALSAVTRQPGSPKVLVQQPQELLGNTSRSDPRIWQQFSRHAALRPTIPQISNCTRLLQGSAKNLGQLGSSFSHRSVIGLAWRPP